MPRLRIEVVYASADREERRWVELDAGADAGDAVAASGLPSAQGLPDGWALGMAGQVIRRSRKLRDGERLEILRPLALDPREARRMRARKARRR